MQNKAKKPASIEEYISQFPPEIQKRLYELRGLIKEFAPAAGEKISYGMPTFYLNGNLVHFAVFKDHYGFFPTPQGIEEFEAETAPYKTGKGTLCFALDEPFPRELIKKIVLFRVKENEK